MLVIGVAFATFVIASLSRYRRFSARYRADGAIAETYADANSRFELVAAPGPTVDLYVRYVMRARSRSGGGISYGMIARLDVERTGVVDAPQGEETFSHHREYLFGGARRGFGEVPLAESLNAGPVHRMGKQISRGLVLVRVPAGGELKVSGRIEMAGGAVCEAFQVFLKPPIG